MTDFTIDHTKDHMEGLMYIGIGAGFMICTMGTWISIKIYRTRKRQQQVSAEPQQKALEMQRKQRNKPKEQLDAERQQREADRARRDEERAKERLSKRMEFKASVKAMKSEYRKSDQYVMRTEGANDVDPVVPPGVPSYNDVMDAASAPPLESPSSHETNAAPAMAFTSTATGYSEGVITSEGGITSDNSDLVKAFLMGIERSFCEEYYELFLNQGIDSMELVRSLSDEELKQIGIQKLGHRKKILMALQ